jgi:hypothetical protein
MNTTTTPPDTEFEAAAVAAFVDVYGEAMLAEFRAAIEEAGGMLGLVLMQLENKLQLSANDRKIFTAVARRLRREIQEQSQ